MLLRRLQDREAINALDDTTVREILNPKHESQPLVLNYSLAHATVKPNEKSLPHKFHEASEVYYILRGTGLMHIDDEVAKVVPVHDRAIRIDKAGLGAQLLAVAGRLQRC